MRRAPTRGWPLTLNEHFFWTIVVTFAACLAVAVLAST